MGSVCSAYGESRGVYRVLVGKLDGNRPLGRKRSRWENNVKMDLQKVVCGGVDWRALVNAVMYIRVP